MSAARTNVDLRPDIVVTPELLVWVGVRYSDTLEAEWYYGDDCNGSS